MKKSRYCGTPGLSSKGQVWKTAAFFILAAMLVAGASGNLFVQNAYAANTLVVNAVALDGRPLNMWTTISSGGSVVRSGHTPLTFVGTTGATYSVTVSDYGSIFFDHWENGSKSRSRTVTLNADMTLTAHFRTSSTHNLAVNSADMAGGALNGFYTVIRSGGATVRTGFTALTFAGNHGTSYSVTVSDYGNMVFDHWENGSTARSRTLTLNADTTLTAHYRNNAPGYTLTVNAVGPSGAALNGYYATVREGSATVKTGFTPLTYQGKSGATLVATVSDYGKMAFDHWENGSTARSRTVTLSKDTTIVAHYRDTSPPPNYTLTINSADMAGGALTGYSVTIQSGTTVAGTTPWAFTGVGGTAYTVTPADGEDMVFDHWENGSADRARTITLGAHTTITAFYDEQQAPQNSDPSAADDSATVDQGASVTVSTLANDSDPDGDSLAVASTTDPANGSATINGDGTINYTPDPGYAGPDSFDYVLSDGRGGTDTGTVAITVNAAVPLPPTTHDLVVQSANMAGGALSGHQVTIQSGETVVRTGATALSFAGNAGASYAVSVQDAGSMVFDHWDDGSTSRSRTVTLNADTTLTAHFKDNTPPPPPSPPTTFALTVNSADMVGTPLTGYYTAITSGSTTVRTGFTSLSYVGNAGATYSVTVSDYGGMVFDHWENGSTSRTRTLTLNSDTAITVHLRDTTPPPPPPPNPDPSPIADLIPKTGVFVALYMYPGGSAAAHWQKVIDEKTEHPSVPIVAAFNPSSGPGNNKDNNIANWVNKLKQAGVIAIGYTYDDYGTRSLAALKADADKYKNWYNADGLFIDEFTNKPGFESHYRDLTNYAKSIGMKMTMGNPGTDVPKSYIGTVDVINITEGRGYMPISWLQYCVNCSASNGWHYQHDKRNFAYIRYDIGTLDTAFETESAKWVGLLYIHSGNDSNGRWFNVPPYFGTLVETLDR